MQYNEFLKELDKINRDIEVSQQYIRFYESHASVCQRGLNILNTYKGDDIVEGHLLLLKPILRDLKMQLFLMQQDFIAARAINIPTNTTRKEKNNVTLFQKTNHG